MQFDEALRYLLSLGHETLALKLGLRNTQLLLNELSNPQRAFPLVQIAGTNGKGSTAVFLDSICRASGLNSGLYTSPHLVSIVERIKTGGLEISYRAFARCAGRVRLAAQELLEREQIEALPTFFEHVTAIALLAFREANVDLAILETGLGGRLDATTATLPETVAITPIALDHEQYLGNTLTEIAAEKAAIIRPGVVAIIGPQEAEALEVILRQSEIGNVTPILEDGRHEIEQVTEDGRFCVTFETGVDRYERVWLGLRGRHQITNASLAIRIAESLRSRGMTIPHQAIVEGLQTAEHAGRLELINSAPALLFDGAHNPSGAESLRDYLTQFGRRPLTLVFGAMRDKRLQTMADLLFPLADNLVLAKTADPRAAGVEELRQEALRLLSASRIFVVESARDAIHVARETTSGGGLICCTGSLYLIGELRSLVVSGDNQVVGRSTART